MKVKPRLALMGLIMLGLTALCIRKYFFAATVDEPHMPTRTTHATPHQTHVLTRVSVAEPTPRKAFRESDADLFSAPPVLKPLPVLPVVALPPQPPAPPQPPPLPFSFIGKEYEAGAWRVFLSQQDNVFVAVEGEIVAEKYKVVRISPPNMEFIYLPLNEKQSLGIGAPHNE